MNTTKLLLVEDHNLVRNGLFSLLNGESQLEVVSQVSNVDEAVNEISSGKEIDLVVSDMNMPDKSGIDLIKSIKSSPSGVKTIILTMLDDEAVMLEALEVGGDGFLLKSCSIDELLFAINHVVNGGQYICTGMVSKLLAHRQRRSTIAVNTVAVQLNDREKEILNHIAEGLTNQEIAERTFSSRRTVEGHRQKLLEKTGTTNTATLIKFALQQGLIS